MAKEVESRVDNRPFTLRQAYILTLGGVMGVLAGAASVGIDRISLDATLEARHPSPVSTNEMEKASATVTVFERQAIATAVAQASPNIQQAFTTVERVRTNEKEKQEDRRINTSGFTPKNVGEMMLIALGGTGAVLGLARIAAESKDNIIVG